MNIGKQIFTYNNCIYNSSRFLYSTLQTGSRLLYFLYSSMCQTGTSTLYQNKSED